jgi:hypothetical protein
MAATGILAEAVTATKTATNRARTETSHRPTQRSTTVSDD